MMIKDKIVNTPWDQPIAPSTMQKVLFTCDISLDNDLTDFRLLDFGCGNGRYLEAFAQYIPKKNLFGAEISLERISQVREKGFICIQLDPKEAILPFNNDSFNVVFSSNVIEHIPRALYIRYLMEIHRVIKPGGRFVVGTPNYPIKRLYDMWKAITTNFTRYYLFDDPTHCNKMSIFRLEKDLKRVFKYVHLEPTYIFFEGKIPLLKNPNVRHILRGFGNKVFGYCIK